MEKSKNKRHINLKRKIISEMITELSSEERIIRNEILRTLDASELKNKFKNMTREEIVNYIEKRIIDER